MGMGISPAYGQGKFTTAHANGAKAVRFSTWDGHSESANQDSDLIPGWAHDDGMLALPMVHRNDSPPWTDIQAWLHQFGIAVNLAGDFRKIEGPNEPYYRTDSGTIADYAKMMAAAMDNLHSTAQLGCQHDTELLWAADGSGGKPGWDPIGVAGAYIAVTGKHLMDHPAFGGWALHLYGPDTITYTAFQQVKHRVNTATLGAPIYLTEFGWQSAIDGSVNPSNEAATVTTAYQLLSEKAIDGALFWDQNRIENSSDPARIWAAMKAGPSA
jgi:hypothetical protein